MKIKWRGKYDGKLPVSELPPNATPLGKVTNKSTLLIIPILVLGIIPLITWLFIPAEYAFANSIVFAFGLFHFGAAYGDFQNIINAIRFVPTKAILQISGEQFYWYL